LIMSGPILLAFTAVALVMALIEWPVLKWLGRVTWKYGLLVALCINVPTVLVWSVVMTWASENVDYVAWGLLVGLPFIWGALAVIVWLTVKTLICVAMLHSWRGLIVAPLTVVWGVGSFVAIVVTSLQQTPYAKLEATYKEDNPEYVQQRLKAGDDASSFMDDAANYRSAKILTVLLDAGASPNAKDSNGVPYLNRVVTPAQAYTVHTTSVDKSEADARALASARTMLEHGADPTQLSQSNVSAIEEAINEGPLPMIELFLEKGAKLMPASPATMPLCIAARSKRADRNAVLELLLKKGADINALETTKARVYINGKWTDGLVKATPLNAAIRAGNEDTALWLLEKGAAPKATHPGQDDPIVDAVVGDRTKVALALLERGADVNLRTEDGRTLWQAASDRILRKELEKRGLQRSVTPLDLTASGVDTPTWLGQVWSHNRSLGWVRTQILERATQQPPHDVSLRLAGETETRVVRGVECLKLQRKLDSGRLELDGVIGGSSTAGLEKLAIPFEGGVLELWHAPE
jgi:ankyrin repeat protein